MRCNLIVLFIIVAICVVINCDDALAFGMISNWSFEEGSGTIAHDSVGPNNGTIYGATWTTGIVGGALSFDGVNDYIYVGDVPSLDISSALTLEAWVKTDKITNDTVISKDDDAGNREYYFGVSYDGNNPGRVRWTLKTNSFQFRDSLVVVNDSQWHHIVGTYDGSYLCTYIDGVEDSRSPVAQTGGIPNTSAPFWIGAKPNIGYEQYFRGVIDEVAVYDRALTSDEIRNRFASPSPVPEPSSMLLFGLGSLVLAAFKKKKKLL